MSKDSDNAWGFEDVLVADNGVCKFYVNSFTSGVEKWAGNWGIDDIKCLLTAQNSNPKDREYVLIRNNDYIYASKSYESLACHIDVVAVGEGRKRE